MGKQLKLLTVLAALLMPWVVKAETTVITSSEPVYYSSSNLFVANGTPIVIEENDGKLYVKWNDGANQQEVKANLNVVGGVFDPSCASNDCKIALEKTSITVNSGSVNTLHAGSLVSKNYTAFKSIEVDTIDVDINGGTVTKVFAHGSGDLKIPRSYYSQIETYYTVKNSNVRISDATITMFVASGSYTFIDNLLLELDNVKVTNASQGIHAGSNGLINKAVFNVKDSDVKLISTGQRSHIRDFEVNITGNSTIGDIYAGSSYPAAEYSANWGTWQFTSINYSHADKLTFNIAKESTYNNIYAGFQFVDAAAFKTKYSAEADFDLLTAGFEKNATAPVVINIANVPSEKNADLISMIDSNLSNVTVNYTTSYSLPEIDTSKPVEEPTMGVTDPTKAEEVLQKEISNSEKALKAISEGKEINVVLEVKTVEATDEVKENVEKLVNNGVILGFFDISVLLKDNSSNVVDEVTTLANPIALSILLPEAVTPAEDGYNRTYYIVREHEGEYELLEATISEDGKTISFVTDKFSNYTLTYVDNKVEENPKTSDSILLAIGIATVSILGLGTCLVYKRNRY